MVYTGRGKDKKAVDGGGVVVSVRGLTKDYATPGGLVTPVLKGLNVDIAAGEFVAIMGPSGSGKSTFMNILGCLDTVTSGSYILNGQDVSGLSGDALADVRSHVLGFVFQGFNLLSRRSILDNVGLPLIAAGAPRAAWEPLARELLVKVGLAGQEAKFPPQLSGGQQQRVAIARALAGRPEVILADEPTGNLDSATSVSIMELFTQLNRDDGMTVILVTHEPDIAAHAGRLLVLRDGLMQYDGPTLPYLKEHGGVS